MSRQTGKKLIGFALVALLIVSLGWFVISHVRFGHSPLWDDVALAYSVCFTVFWVFDIVGRQETKFRAEDDRVSRPAPNPNVSGQRVALAGGLSAAAPAMWFAQGLQLHRPQAADAELLQRWFDAAVTEVLTLGNVRPQANAVPGLADTAQAADVDLLPTGVSRWCKSLR